MNRDLYTLRPWENLEFGVAEPRAYFPLAIFNSDAKLLMGDLSASYHHQL